MTEAGPLCLQWAVVLTEMELLKGRYDLQGGHVRLADITPVGVGSRGPGSGGRRLPRPALSCLLGLW